MKLKRINAAVDATTSCQLYCSLLYNSISSFSRHFFALLNNSMTKAANESNDNFSKVHIKLIKLQRLHLIQIQLPEYIISAHE